MEAKLCTFKCRCFVLFFVFLYYARRVKYYVFVTPRTSEDSFYRKNQECARSPPVPRTYESTPHRDEVSGIGKTMLPVEAFCSALSVLLSALRVPTIAV